MSRLDVARLTGTSPCRATSPTAIIDELSGLSRVPSAMLTAIRCGTARSATPRRYRHADRGHSRKGAVASHRKGVQQVGQARGRGGSESIPRYGGERVGGGLNLLVPVDAFRGGPAVSGQPAALGELRGGRRPVLVRPAARDLHDLPPEVHAAAQDDRLAAGGRGRD